MENRETDISLSVILPVYNEEDAIETVVDSAMKELPRISNEYEIILINDGSTDSTKNIINSLAKNNRYIKCVHHRRNIGYGAAIKSGFKAARYPFVFFMDSDGQFDIAEISKLLRHIGTFDIVVGLRTVRRDSLYRVTITRCFNFVTRSLFKIRIKDISCGFKLFKKSIFNEFGFKSKSGFINAEILFKAQNKGFAIKEVEIRHFPRSKGRQKGATLRTMRRKICDLIKLYRERK